MPFAGTLPSSALLLLLVLWAEAQPVKGAMPNNGYCEVLAGNATAATVAAEMCMCCQGSVFNGEARLMDKAPVSVLLPGALLLNAEGAAPSPPPSPTPERQLAPPPILPGAAPAHIKGLSWRAKAWVLAVAMLIIVFVSRPQTSPVPRGIDGDGELFYCAICMEAVPGILKFSVGSCGHEFCLSCVAQYVAAKLGENLARVECPDPGCGGVGAVEPESCRGIISPDLLDKWGFLLCESAFGAKKVYCPYRECSVPLLADGESGITQAECPHCHWLFCARCSVPWHAGIECREFQQLGQDERGRDDLLLRLLAGRQRWQSRRGAPSARCTWRNRKGAITSNAGVDTASATDVHPRCPRKPITATSASASDLFGLVMDRELSSHHQAGQ